MENTANNACPTTEKYKKQAKFKANIERWIFFFVILVVPVAQFCIFYIGVNIDTVVLSFQKYDNGVFTDNGFENYKRFFFLLTEDKKLIYSFQNSTIQFVLGILISTPLSIMIAYYLYLKIPGAEIFKVVLMLPQLIASMVFICIYKYIFNNGLVPLLNWNANVFVVAPTQFYSVLFYNIFIGLAGHLVLYLGAMTHIDESVMEYGDLDGLGTLGKLWHVVIPAIYPTITVFMMTSLAAFFTNQANLYSFFGEAGVRDESYTFGYWLFLFVHNASDTTPAEFPLAATAGVCFTVVSAPLVLLFKYCLERFGPKEE